MEVLFKALYDDVKVPAYATVGSVGCDLIAHNFKEIYKTGNTMSSNPNSNIVGGIRGADGQWYIPEDEWIPKEYRGRQMMSDRAEFIFPVLRLDLDPGDRALIGCGFAVALPEEYEMQIRPRSGNALKYGITVLNTPGTIDVDYRHEVGVILINQSADRVTIKKGDKIAQAVISKFDVVVFRSVKELPDPNSTRTGGFGSTDKRPNSPTENY